MLIILTLGHGLNRKHKDQRKPTAKMKKSYLKLTEMSSELSLKNYTTYENIF
jgi:hypothetical protein